MLVHAFDNRYGTGLYTPKYDFPNNVEDGIQRFETLSILHSSSYNYFNVHIKQVF